MQSTLRVMITQTKHVLGVFIWFVVLPNEHLTVPAVLVVIYFCCHGAFNSSNLSCLSLSCQCFLRGLVRKCKSKSLTGPKSSVGVRLAVFVSYLNFVSQICGVQCIERFPVLV